MTQTSSFRGTAGEVLLYYFSLGTWLTVIALNIIYALCFVLLGLLKLDSGAQQFAVILLLLLLPAFFLGRFAIGAARGNLAAGILAGECTFPEAAGFAVRYLLVTAVCLVPAGAVAAGAISNLSIGAAALSPGWSALGLLIFVLWLFVVPIFAAAAAACSQSMADLFSGQLWAGILIERREDFLVLIAALSGGTIVFFLLYLIPLAALAVFLLSADVVAGATFIGTVAPALLGSSVPILLGRLCGAFASNKENEAAPPVRAGAPAPQAPQLSTVIRPAAANADAALFEWAQTTLPAHDEVLAAYFFNHAAGSGEFVPAVGLDLKPGVDLSPRRQLFEKLSQSIGASGAKDEVKELLFITDTMRRSVANMGQRIYSRKGG